MLVLALAAPASAIEPAPVPLATKLSQALAVPHVDQSRSAALAIDLTTGEVVFARHQGLSLAPASTEKLAVAYSALVAFGPSFRIRTDVIGRGTRRGSTWDGSLVLKGYGDPTLSLPDLRALAREVRALGIRRITGAVLGDESYFDSVRTAPGWKPRFYLNESPSLSALTVERGRLHGRDSHTPALAAAAAFGDALAGAGVAVSGTVALAGGPTAEPPLVYTLSEPLWRIVRYMGVESDNFTAEILLKQLGTLGAARGTTAAGVAMMRRLLAADGIPLAGVRLVDGSGLSTLNRLTASTLVGIIRAALSSPQLRRSFIACLPVAGRTGTLEHRLERLPALGTVRAKTGSTSWSSSLSGLVGRRYVFAVLHNGQPVSKWWARHAQDRFATVLAAQ